MLANLPDNKLLTISSSSNRVFIVARSQGKNNLQVAPRYSGLANSAAEPTSLEQFIGMWSDLTEEEETLFAELLSSRHVDFERPLLDLFTE